MTYLSEDSLARTLIYDSLDRLTSEIGTGITQSFTWDGNGNRLTDGAGGYSYAPNTNREVSSPQGAVVVDGAGYTTSDRGGARSFTWSPAGDMATATMSGTTATYAYRDDHLRASKTVGGNTTLYHYDLNGRLIAETTTAGATIRKRGGNKFGRYVTLFCLFIFTFSGQVYAEGAEAEDLIVYRLYRDFSWVAVIKSESVFTPIAKQPRNVLDRYFDRELSNLLVRDANCNRAVTGEVCNLDFDPMFASQDPSAQDLVITKTAAGVVLVEFTYPPSGERIRLIYKTHLEKRGWRITDIVYENKAEVSLKNILVNKLLRR